jgi:hypothetical protein
MQATRKLRKLTLFFCYSGLATSLPQFAAGGVIAGMGGSGMRSLVSSLIVREFQVQHLGVIWLS